MSYSSGNILTLVLFVFMPQIAYKETRTLHTGKIMIFLLITIIPQITLEDTSVTLSLITIMLQII